MTSTLKTDPGGQYSHPVLAFEIMVLTQGTTIRVHINNREAVTIGDMDKSHARGYWEAINVPQVVPNKTSFPTINPLTCVALSGKAVISDVILWYQVNV